MTAEAHAPLLPYNSQSIQGFTIWSRVQKR